MSATEITEILSKIDQSGTDLIFSLRMAGVHKQLDRSKFDQLVSLLEKLESLLTNQPLVRKELVGTLLFIFTSMLAEANHAKIRAPIDVAAWEISEILSRIFGPNFPEPTQQIPDVPL